MVSLLVCAVASAQIEVEATVNANRIGVEDVLELTVAVSGDVQQASQPQLPELEGFDVAGRPSFSQRVSIVNGQSSASHAYTYSLVPRGEGTFPIGAVTVSYRGEEFRTRPITVEVVAGSVVPRRVRRVLDPFSGGSPFFGGRSAPELKPEDIYVETELSKDSVFEGEQLVVTYRLFTKVPILGLEVNEDPPMTGFWVEEVALDPNRNAERRTINGERWLTAPIKQRVVFPAKTGRLEIPGIGISMAARVDSGDPFDSFFGRATQPLSRETRPVSLEVKPLPSAGRPAGFNGLVGRFELKAALNTSEVEAGSPVTLTVAVEGSGNLRSVETPKLPPLAGFRTFAPNADEKLSATASGFRGNKQWEFVLVPQTAGNREVGPLTLDYFDPGRARYVTAKAGPLDIRVTGTDLLSGDGAPAAAGRGEVRVLQRDIRYLKDAPESLGEKGEPFHRSWLFYLSLGLPVLWNLGFIFYRRRQAREQADVALFRSRRAHKMARGRLKRAAKLASDQSMEFYEEFAATLYRYVGDKAGVSPSGLTTLRIDQILAERGAEDRLKAEVVRLLDKCEEARFTPGERSRSEMESLLARAEEVIVSLEKALS